MPNQSGHLGQLASARARLLGGLLGKLSYLARDYRKTLPALSGVSGFDLSVHRGQISLACNALNDQAR